LDDFSAEAIHRCIPLEPKSIAASLQPKLFLAGQKHEQGCACPKSTGEGKWRATVWVPQVEGG